MNIWTKRCHFILELHLRPTVCIDFKLRQRAVGRGINVHTGLNYTYWYIWCLGQLDLGQRRHLYFRKHPGLAWQVFIVKFHGPKALTYDQHRLTWRGWVDETPPHCKRRRDWRRLVA
jgi:hypothetical protein